MNTRIQNLPTGELSASDFLPFDGAGGTKKVSGSLILNKADKTQLANRNLLDNPWWASGEVVNQRGVESGTLTNILDNPKYVIDRWIMGGLGGSANTFSLGSNGITFTKSNNDTSCHQLFENHAALVGKVLTASILFSDGTILSGTITRTNGTLQHFFNTDDVAIRFLETNEFSVSLKATKTVRAVKLELGNVSTLHMDVAPNYSEELLKCQRFFYRLSAKNGMYQPLCVGNFFSTSHFFGTVTFPVKMRTSPTCSVSNVSDFRIICDSNNMLTPTDITATNVGLDSSLIDFTVTNNILGHGAHVRGGGAGTATMDFTADL